MFISINQNPTSPTVNLQQGNFTVSIGGQANSTFSINVNHSCCLTINLEDPVTIHKQQADFAIEKQVIKTKKGTQTIYRGKETGRFASRDKYQKYLSKSTP